MTMNVRTIEPAQAQGLIAAGARLIDIRGRQEHARERIAGAENRPLDELVAIEGEEAVIFHCQGGNRTMVNAPRLTSAATGDVYMLAGGIGAWKRHGLPTIEQAGQPIDLMRQVQLGGGLMILLASLLAWLVSPAFLLFAAAIGVGMVHAGATGSCTMTALLAPMPWNRRPACSQKGLLAIGRDHI